MWGKGLFALGMSTMLLAVPVAGGARADTATASEEPLQYLQWGLDLIDGPEAWERATGEGVVVAIVDEGVDDDHPDLPADKFVDGASWWGCGLTEVPPCFDEAAWDAGSHGTEMAGIVAAPRNGVGTAGVAPDAQIMPVRVAKSGALLFFDIQDVFISYVYVPLGIIWAVDHGADVINLSLGSVFPETHNVGAYAYLWAEAVEYANQHGVVVVAAAGNDGESLTSAPICENEYVAIGNVVCVGAVGPDDQRSSFSRQGLGVDVYAPGGEASCGERQILSLVPLNRWSPCPLAGEPGYGYAAGTSHATAFVSGVAALLAEQGIRGQAAAERIVETADPLDWEFPSNLFAPVRVNAARAVGAIG